ncbi:MAG: hypothetical protein RDU14_17600 [Melioribacteraceae bacterium]|nr:hypothetical protein [Melioribacteraceae bacterium]
MKLSDLKEAPYNPRDISEEALKGLSTSIGEFGDLSGIVFNERTGNLVAGHQRIKALKEKYGDIDIAFGKDGSASIFTPDSHRFSIRLVDWPIEKEKLANITANNPNIQGEFTHGLQLVISDLKVTAHELLTGLKIDQLEIKPLDHEINLNVNIPEELPKASLNVTIGEYTFKVPREVYLEWIEKLKMEVGFSDQEVNKEIQRRLQLEY